jgi:hypothetical protein
MIFVYCKDRRFYENLIYQDNPLRREWYLCFDEKEPAELVVKKTSQMNPKMILTRRGFPWRACYNGRSCQRFFGAGEQDNANAVSWFVSFVNYAPLPTPIKFDVYDEVWPIHPNKDGVYWGIK